MNQWLNEKNWLNLPQTQEAIIQKKSVFHALTLTKQNFQTRFNSIEEKQTVDLLCKDIDCCSYILSHYMYQHEKLEQLPNIKKHFENIDHVKYILSNGVIDPLEDFLFKEHQILTEDKELVMKVLKNNRNGAKKFHDLFKDYNFVLDCLKKKIVCIDFLEVYPQNKIITKKALKSRLFPRKENLHLYNEDVLKDKAFILPILLESNGYFLYSFLPPVLRQDLELCDALKAQHPHVQVEVSSINTLDKFINSINSKVPFASELYTVINNMEKSDFIINDSNAITQVLITVGEHKCSCYVDLMGDPSFTSHPVQDFLNKVKVKHQDIASFLNTQEGKKIINFKISNYHQFTEFEEKVLPTLGPILDNYLQMYKLNNVLSENKKPNNHSKI